MLADARANIVAQLERESLDIFYLNELRLFKDKVCLFINEFKSNNLKLHAQASTNDVRWKAIK